MQINHLNNQITESLNSHLKSSLGPLPSSFYEVFDYALFPTGKLFRANLVWRYFCDINKIELSTLDTSKYPNIQLLASSIELHHAYTLIHDDLPCMDDDDYRRGKPSVHKKYNEWMALLAGDGLLSLSYELISTINHQRMPDILKKMCQLCGATGLILGQYLDLSQGNDQFNFEKLLNIHQLKTANLFTISLLGANYLSESENTHTDQNTIKLGNTLGIIFQLIDDLTELNGPKISEHELAINPWINDFNRTYDAFKKYFGELNDLIQSHQHIAELKNNYTDKVLKVLKKDKIIIERNIKTELDPVISVF